MGILKSTLSTMNLSEHYKKIQPKLKKRIEKPSFSVVLSFLFFLLVFLFYAWTVSNGSLDALKWTQEPKGYHCLLADAFLHGQTFLLIKPSPDLLNLIDPYDPIANAQLRLHDASLYNNHYYLYFTPSVALFILAPFKALTGYFISEALLTALFCYIGFLAVFFSFKKIIKTQSIKLTLTMNLACILAFALLSMIPYLLRRPAVYELCIATAYASLMIALYCLVTVLESSKKSRLKTVLFGVFLGLSILARPNQVFTCTFLSLALLYWRRVACYDNWKTLAWTMLWIGGPVLCVLLVMFSYNFQRYGSFFEFGSSYMLSGFNSRTMNACSLSYMPLNIYYYFFQTPYSSFNFPFIHALPTPDLLYQIKDPHKIYNVEPVIGLLGLPLFWLFIVPVFYLKQMRAHSPLTTRYALLFLVAGLVSLMSVSIAGGISMRYIVDFLPLLLLSLLLFYVSFLHLLALHLPRTRFRLGQTIFFLLLGASILISLATSITGYSDQLKTENPKLYQQLKQWFPVENFYAHDYFFKINRIKSASHYLEPIMYRGIRGSADLIYLEYKNDEHVRIGIDHWGTSPQVTAWFNKDEIDNKNWHVHINDDLLSVRVGSYYLRVKPHSLSRFPKFGINDIGFSLVAKKAHFKIHPI